MTRKPRLLSFLAILAASIGMMMASAPPGNAATGADGFTILYASSDNFAHKCNVLVSDDGGYQAVVCADVLTYEGATDYYAYARGEVFCQYLALSGTEIIPCESMSVNVSLETGAGATGTYSETCYAGTSDPCPNGRLYASTRNWVYATDIPSGQCSDNVNSSYQVWGVVWGDSWIQLPNGDYWEVNDGQANDGANQSTGHYFVCP